MKLGNWIAAALLLAPAVGAQVTPAAVNTKAVFAIMQRNVSNIKQPAERERWDANLAMWQVVLSTSGKLTRGELDLLRGSLERIQRNVSNITPPGEEQRWLANIALWKAFIDDNITPGSKAAETVTATFEKMKANIARLNDSPEKERWQANIDLWQVQLTPPPAHAGAANAVAARWNVGLTFSQFIARDPSRQEVWDAAYRDAAARVDSVIERARAIPGHYRVLVVAESWCSDALRAVPVLSRLAAQDSALDIRLLRKADAQDLLQTHLFAGRAATPLVLVYDEQFREGGVWTERPAAGHTVLEEFLALLERPASACR